MPDAALLTHPANRRYIDAIKQGVEKICERYGLRSCDVGFSRQLPIRRRASDGTDDGPYFVLRMDQSEVSMKLVGPGIQIRSGRRA